MLLIWVLLFASLAACKPTVYMIRHGEKPADGSVGLSKKGEMRAQCLRRVFGRDSHYNIGYIMAQGYNKNGKKKRPYDTVLPLANDLGIQVDTSCDCEDNECVANAIHNYKGEGNILVSWKHGPMRDIVHELGAKNARKYPRGEYDVIWTVEPPYDRISHKSSERCPGLDIYADDATQPGRQYAWHP